MIRYSELVTSKAGIMWTIMHAQAYQNECFASEPIKVRKETCKHETKACSLLSCYQITLVSSLISLLFIGFLFSVTDFIESETLHHDVIEGSVNEWRNLQ
jgi:hypothetical protein